MASAQELRHQAIRDSLEVNMAMHVLLPFAASEPTDIVADHPPTCTHIWSRLACMAVQYQPGKYQQPMPVLTTLASHTHRCRTGGPATTELLQMGPQYQKTLG